MGEKSNNPYAESAHIAAALDFLERATQAMNGAIGALVVDRHLTAVWHSKALEIGMAIDDLTERIHRHTEPSDDR